MWNYDKSEEPQLGTAKGAEEAGVDWDVVATDDWTEWDGRGWRVVRKIEGLAGLKKGGKFGLEMRREDKIGILVRDKR